VKPLPRRVEAEWLDTLPVDDPRARHSRRDLRRLNLIMNHAAGIRRALRKHWPASAGLARPPRIVELGAGDGLLLLRVARAGSLRSRPATLCLVDRQPACGAATVQHFAALGWPAESVKADVFEWLSRAEASADIVICNLFLHHFDTAELARLLHLIGQRTGALIAFEPARTRLARLGSRLLGLIGCNDVTRHDALVSVAAGFRGRDLSALWPAQAGWRLEERRAGLFSHVFIATRTTALDR
jgi:2-polyprenyl-3-methyl-5-hydroxy-6-metoxy-1,4-benzoquinol methylase